MLNNACSRVQVHLQDLCLFLHLSWGRLAPSLGLNFAFLQLNGCTQSTSGPLWEYVYNESGRKQQRFQGLLGVWVSFQSSLRGENPKASTLTICQSVLAISAWEQGKCCLSRHVYTVCFCGRVCVCVHIYKYTKVKKINQQFSGTAL